MNELVKINYEQNSRQYRQEIYMKNWKLANDSLHGLRRTVKDLLKDRIIQAYFQVRL